MKICLVNIFVDFARGGGAAAAAASSSTSQQKRSANIIDSTLKVCDFRFIKRFRSRGKSVHVLAR